MSRAGEQERQPEWTRIRALIGGMLIGAFSVFGCLYIGWRKSRPSKFHNRNPNLCEVTPTDATEPTTIRNAGLLARILMGIVFLGAGLPKTWDPGLFFWDVVPYTFLLGLDESSSALVERSALSLGPVECIVGVALLLNWKRSVVFPVATVLMAFFTVLVTLAWMQGYDESCGCFGTFLDRSAGEAVVEDVAMLALLVLAWVAGRRSKAHLARSGEIVAGAACLFLVLGSIQFVGARDRISDSDLKAGVSLSGMSVQGETPSITEGEVLIVVMTPTCARCRRAVPRINRIITEGDVPDVVGLTHYDQDSKELVALRETLEPAFPIGTVTKKDFMRLAWGHGVPRMALLRNGEVVQVWEAHDLTDVEDLASLIPRKL